MLSFFPPGVLDEILNLIESVSEDFPSYSYHYSLQSNGLLNQTGSAVSLYDVINVGKYVLTSTS